LNTAWDIATHMAELVAAHGLVEAGKTPIKHSAGKVVAWLHAHLNEADQPKLAAVEINPASKPAQAALALHLNALMEAQPDLVAVLRDLVKAAPTEGGGMNQVVGDNSRAIQNRGSGNTNTISG
jgi:hypothetical protein